MAKKPKKVLFGGVFDLLHWGHVLQICRASTFGTQLVVHVASDKMVRNKKGENRPVIPEDERVKLVRHVKEVAEVVCFSDWERLDMEALIKIVKPDVVVLNHGEKPLYNEENICKKHGIEIVRLHRAESSSGLDTTKIIERIKAL